MDSGKILYHVFFYDGTHYYFGSISAIFDRFTSKDIGVTKESLWNYGVGVGRPYINSICTVQKGVLVRKKGNRKNPFVR